MKPEIKYELWKNAVVTEARKLYAAAQQVGAIGLQGLEDYNKAHDNLWDVLKREPK